jgi:tetratricopeptide (TPR) repeat protein
MKRYSNLCLIALFALAAACFVSALNGHAIAGGQQSKAAPAAQAQESENTDYSEDEYNAYDAAKKEPDLEKKSVMLFDFIAKYPKSTLMQYIDFEYRQLLDDLSAAKKYELLESLGEKWLKTHPGEVRTIGHLADAASSLKKYDKCAEYLEELYKTQPSGTMAKTIFQTYQNANNLAKQLEWVDKLFKMPEFDAEYMLRWGFVRKHMDSNNIPKAAEYAQLTLKSADLVKQPTPEQQEELKKIRQVCLHIIGISLFEKNKFNEAIAIFDKAIKIEKYSDGYYFMGRCLDNQAAATKSQDKAEEAMNAYAKCELLKGDNAAKAKDRIIELYKAVHNNSTIGIDKVYRRAKEELGIK